MGKIWAYIQIPSSSLTTFPPLHHLYSGANTRFRQEISPASSVLCMADSLPVFYITLLVIADLCWYLQLHESIEFRIVTLLRGK